MARSTATAKIEVSLRQRLVAKAECSSLRRLVRHCFQVRLAVLLSMAVSCRVIPNHHAGEDATRFDLRAQDPACFSTKGSYCDCGPSCSWREGDGLSCQEPESIEHNLFQSVVYPFLLTPLTRWDAARFLRLAHRPQLWLPQTNGQLSDTDLFQESERAHVFMPLFPSAVQRTASVLMLLPKWSLPSTCEQVMVLAAWFLNTLCCLLSAVSLYFLTENILRRQGVADLERGRLSRLAMLVFIYNPATVFFGTAYSEAMFSTFVFAGCCLHTQGHDWIASVFWAAGSGTRSNGILYVGYILLFGLGRFLRPQSLLERLQVTGKILLQAFLPCAVLIRHNRVGIAHHCDSEALDQPAWCALVDRASLFPRFNLYSYTQRQYWNVGIFKYYEVKQVPNFLLAAPILLVSSAAVMTWIRCQWTQLPEATVTRNTLIHVAKWASIRLQQFSGHLNGQGYPKKHDNREKTLVGEMALEAGPLMLGHYAVLAATIILGLTVAHVQISTRMICSTCPALYWFLATKVGFEEKRISPKVFVLGDAICWYCLSYTVLGIIMHSTWLPWT
jgi:phosphatidylinositol glycan class V